MKWYELKKNLIQPRTLIKTNEIKQIKKKLNLTQNFD